ncbi:hypothetical protein RFI_21337 [Reticulomyxa filosa]|uniref:Uncharacterized protein n=1 Tax=Reticulomyxa filosa TaxID=46433 RepID=X6MRF1_RETFI|nr:hypothetical protein RFI_21337 [Reticulomyxa filosa]|eukprot:ETO16022.1 hypothetical protein RFI_21337 [Reticulomyxa filosa]
MLLVFIPIGTLPGTVGCLIPLVSICYLVAINTCLACESGDTGMVVKMPVRWLNGLGCVFIALALFVLIYMENSSYLRHSNDYSSQFLANVILMLVGGLPLSCSDVLKRSLLSKHRVDSLSFNLILSLLTMPLLWLCAPIAFKIQYTNQPHTFDMHCHSYSDIASNFANGWKCILLNKDSYTDAPVKDACPSVMAGVGHPILLLILFLFAMTCNRFFVHKFVEESMDTGTTQHLISSAHILAFLLFYLSPIQQLVDLSESEFSISIPSFTWKSVICVFAMVIGLYLCFRNINERIQHRNQISDDKWIGGEDE